MTLRSSDLQSDSDLDSIRNSCDVYLRKALYQWTMRRKMLAISSKMVWFETEFGLFITTRSILGPMPFFCSPPIEVPMRCNSLVGTSKHSLNYAANLQRHQINSGWGSLKCKARVWFCYIHRASQNKLLSELLDLALPSPVGCLLIIAGLQRGFKQAPLIGAEFSNSKSDFVLGHPVLCGCDPSSLLDWILCFVSSFQSYFRSIIAWQDGVFVILGWIFRHHPWITRDQSE